LLSDTRGIGSGGVIDKVSKITTAIVLDPVVRWFMDSCWKGNASWFRMRRPFATTGWLFGMRFA
jgi:hypothetical protein